MGEKLKPEHKTKIEEAKTKLEAALKDNSPNLRTAMDELNQAWSEASTEMYQNASQAQGAPGAEGQPAGGEQQAKKDDNVEEADYTIVDDEK